MLTFLLIQHHFNICRYSLFQHDLVVVKLTSCLFLLLFKLDLVNLLTTYFIYLINVQLKMATLEDKILGEKLHNYCSSSEESDNENSDSEEKNNANPASEAIQPTEINKWEGTSTNTGPKGVIKDWQNYKKLESEKRREDELQKIELMKKLTLTVQSALDEERERAALEDPDMAELLNDEFLVTYQKQRMQEMLAQTNHKVIFGKCFLSIFIMWLL